MIQKLSLYAVIAVSTLGLATEDAAAELTFGDDPIPEFAALAAEEDITLELLPEDGDDDVDQLLINGMVVSSKNFPGVLRMTTGGTCTAALIGPATVLFAAHCLGNNVRINFRAAGTTVRGICQKAPGYNPTTHHQDWALCLLERPASGIIFETVDVDAKPGPGERLMLSGFGCTFEDGPLDGRLRVGFSDVVNRPSGFRREPSAIFTHSAINAGEAVLCPGDSGGPLFRTGDAIDSARQIVGVNSRTTYSHGVSIFSATASPEGAAFIRGWSEVNNQEICGVNREIGCK
ncbi:Trypsin-like protease precursor [Phaeobacter inhibens]|uniref:Trypsin-like protease n=1 Tax=Phaeobacter inhibens TaxID=221822 RepID=A0A2I7JT54_9RHOB|nr:S1 family peptidase [Phaeobacter inhibens]AUQ49039.1 Trypsin-like protease precursor [Phaeobacter inhibens]AUQ93539.1 Trypsin-like protease precursor [Phaeobacter inhibens]AUQ99981.1 Trypsin-like protease precursor [Phaeobacter inhibens]AUR18842.1 Trypsin-like protease precursor [Phaeobacter inhibens]